VVASGRKTRDWQIYLVLALVKLPITHAGVVQMELDWARATRDSNETQFLVYFQMSDDVTRAQDVDPRQHVCNSMFTFGIVEPLAVELNQTISPGK
jgi:hypothetical protein